MCNKATRNQLRHHRRTQNLFCHLELNIVMHKLRCIIQICLFTEINSSPRRSGSPLILELSWYTGHKACSIKTCWQDLEGEISKAKNGSSKNGKYSFRVDQQEQSKRTMNVEAIKSEWEPADIGDGPPVYVCVPWQVNFLLGSQVSSSLK